MKQPFSGLEAAKRATKSQEVDLSRLKGLHLPFAPKMRSGVTCNCCPRLYLDEIPTKTTELNVCAFLLRRKTKFVYSLRTKILNEN